LTPRDRFRVTFQSMRIFLHLEGIARDRRLGTEKYAWRRSFGERSGSSGTMLP